jgi:5-methylcytosine-specific restriction endonuclease McrA
MRCESCHFDGSIGPVIADKHGVYLCLCCYGDGIEADLKTERVGRYNRTDRGKEVQREFAERTKKLNRYVILTRDNRACAVCGYGPGDGVKLELDHVVPRSKGGADTAGNLVTLCKQCNGHKSATELGPEDLRGMLVMVAGRNFEAGIKSSTRVKGSHARNREPRANSAVHQWAQDDALAEYLAAG